MRNNKIDKRQHLIVEALSAKQHSPQISIVMPVYNPPTPYFQMAVASIFAQWFSHWELCIANDASPDPKVKPLLDQLAKDHGRVKVRHRPQNGHISLATNSAVELASGEFIAFVDQDDEITPDCLALLALYIAEHPETDIVYTDDDKIDTNGNCFDQQYKHGPDPFQLLSFMNIGHIFCVRKSLYLKLGGFRKGFEGSQDYDFALRAVEHARHIGHIPVITYHWRSIPGSTAAGGDEKSYSFDAGLRAVQEALERRGLKGTAIHPDWAKACGCGLFGVDFSNTGEEVSVLLPLTKLAPYTKRCLQLLDKTAYKNVHFVVIAPKGDTIELPSNRFTLLTVGTSRLDVATLCNIGAQAVQTPWIAFLSPDLAPHYSSWLSQMLGWSQMEKVGCVGGKIYSLDAHILHAGFFYGVDRDGVPGNPYAGEKDQWGNHFRLVSPMRCDAVSGSCMLIRKELFERFNGFDNEQFGKDLYAVDLCYRLAKEGLVSLFCPDARFTCQTKERTFSLYDKNEQVKFRGRYKRQKSRANPNLRGGKPIPYAHPVHLGRALKILMVTHGLAPEGAPKSFQTLCLGLQEKEPGSKIVWSHAEGPLKNHFVQHDIPVTVLQHKKSVIRLGPGASDLDVYVAKSLSFLEMSSVDDFDLSLKMLGQRMIDKQIDVVFANTVLTFWAVLAAAQVGIPCVWVIRESEPPLSHLAALPQFVQDAAETCFAFAYRVVFVAHATKKLFQKRFPGDNFTVVHNALQSYEPLCLPKKRQQIRQKLKVKDQELLVLMLGTVFKRKGQEDFIQAISLLPEEIVENVRFVIVGDRPDTDYSHEIHELAKCLPQKRKERLVILKETTSPDDYYQAADIFLCCSRIESFPLVILEAMKYALPIITTPVFGISEQVADKESALFYPPGDAKALARQLERVVLDQNLRKKLGEGARNALNLLPTYNELIDKYYQIIREASFS